MLLTRRLTLLSSLASLAIGPTAQADSSPDVIRIGQATVALSFVKIFAARALNTFPSQNLSLQWAQIQGGDAAALAAVDAGDLDLAAIGSDTALAAIAKGQPFQIVYSLMSKFPYDLTVSNAFLQKAGISKSDSLKKRISVLKSAVVGVSALGGAQERAAQWLAFHGGLDPHSVKVAVAGSPPALGAALSHGEIDAFMLSPPESIIAETQGYGTVLVTPNREIPEVKGLPALVLAAQSGLSADAQARIVRAIRALDAATATLISDPKGTADKIAMKFFPKVEPAIIETSIASLSDGLHGKGILTPGNMAQLLHVTAESGGTIPSGNTFWTNAYVEAAAKA
jgi:ABC-type nitrate/sulfonate/bicarbonate transport system substrate-binding protein